MRALASLLSMVGVYLLIHASAVAAQAAPVEGEDSAAPNPYDERVQQPPIVVNIVQQQQQAQVVQDRRPRRTRYSRIFDVTLLSPSEQARYWELEGSRRRIGFPVALTAVSGAGVLAVFVAYAALAGMTCEDYDTGKATDCSMPPGALGFAIFPAIGVAIGAVMLARRVPRRREFRALTRKGTRVEPLALRDGLGLRLGGSF